MIQFEEVSKIYRSSQGRVKALDAANLSVERGEFLAVQGPSGSGKTTLLMAAGGMMHPSEGKVRVEGEDIYALGPGPLSTFRARNIGFIFQMYYLVPYLDVMENVLLAGKASKKADKEMRAKALVDKFGLTHRIHHKPAELSAGERQRTAIARALFNEPKVVLADEPTGNLDPENEKEVASYLSDYHRQGGTVVVVTHGEAMNKHADRVLHLEDGAIRG